MNNTKQTCLKKAGWKVGTAKEFLGLSDDEAALIEMRLALSAGLKQRRIAKRLTQHGLAKKLGSSQSRVAKMEAADASVSIDLLVRSLLALGATRQQIARIIAQTATSPVA